MRNRDFAILAVILAITSIYFPPATFSIEGEQEWVTFKGNPERTGVATSGPASEKLEIAWTASGTGAILGSPCIAEGKVYTSFCIGKRNGTASIRCYDLYTGELAWSNSITGDTIFSPAYYMKMVYVATTPRLREGITESEYRQNGIICFEANSGKELWRFKADAPVCSSPTIFNDRLYFTNFEGTFFCIDPKSGKKQWSTKVTTKQFFSDFAIADDQIVVAATDEYIYCLNTKSGTIRWKSKSPLNIESNTPCMTKDKLYIGTSTRKMLCINVSNGMTVWEFNTQNPITSCPSLQGNKLIFSTMDPNQQSLISLESDCKLYCLDAATGKEVWSLDSDIGTYTSPIIANGIVFCSYGKGLFNCIDFATGKLLESYSLNTYIQCTPSVASRCVLVGGNDGMLRCFNEPLASPSIADFGEVKRGESKQIEINLINPTSSEIKYELEKEGDWFNIEQKSVSIGPNKSAKLKMTLLADANLKENDATYGEIKVTSKIRKTSIMVMAYLSEEDSESCKNWAMQGNNSGHNTSVLQSCSPQSTILKTLWTKKYSDFDFFNICSDPKRVFLACGGLLKANTRLMVLDISGGDTFWKNEDINSFQPTLAVDKNRVFVGTSFGISTYERGAGKLLWRFSTGFSLASFVINHPIPIVSKGKVYFGADDGKCYAVEGSTGKKIWEFNCETPLSKAVTISENQVFVNCGSKLICLDAQTGKKQWETNFSETSTNNPTFANGNIYISSYTIGKNENPEDKQGDLLCIDGKTGKIKWELQTTSVVLDSTPVQDDKLYFAGSNGSMFCINAEKPNIVWTTKLPGAVYTAPILAPGRLFVACDNKKVHCISSEDGAKLWETDVEEVVRTPIIMQNGRLFVINIKGKLFCFGDDPKAKPNSLRFDKPEVTLELGQKKTLRANVMDTNDSPLWGQKIIYNAVPEGIISINQDGKAEAMGVGKCVIEATFGEYTAKLDVEVVEKIPPKILNAIDFGEIDKNTSKTVDLKITNPSYLPTTIKITTEEWLEADKTEMTLESGQTYVLRLKIRPEFAKAGARRSGVVKIEWEQGSLDIPVSFLCKGLFFSRTQFDFNEMPPYEPIQRTLLIKNQTDETFNLMIEPKNNLVKVNPTSFELPPGEEMQVQLAIDTDPFDPGKSYEDLLKVTWDTGEIDIGVKIAMANDTTPPEIKIDQPLTLYNATSIEIKGTVEKGSTVMVNGAKAKVDGNVFIAKVALPFAPSKFDITIEAVDRAGNTNKTTVTITNIKRRIVKMTVGSGKMLVNDEEKTIDPPPTVIKGTTMVPVRAIAEAFEAKTEYFKETNSVQIMLGDIKIILFIGSENAMVNGEMVKVTPPAQIVKGKTMVPFRFIAEALGAKVEWDAATKTITLTMEKVPQ